MWTFYGYSFWIRTFGKFKKDDSMIVLYMLEKDRSYLFAELKEGKWKLLSLIPEEIISEIDYYSEADTTNL